MKTNFYENTILKIGSLLLLFGLIVGVSPKTYASPSILSKKQTYYDSATKKTHTVSSSLIKMLTEEYYKKPTEENYQLLKDQVEKEFDRILFSKEERLQILKTITEEYTTVDALEELVKELKKDKNKYVIDMMIQFTEHRPLPNEPSLIAEGFMPIAGTKSNISIGYTPVTIGEYVAYLKANDRDYSKYKYVADDIPVTNVSYYEALDYCRWKSQGKYDELYRLPTEEEWELAAGHMPKYLDINQKELNAGILPVSFFKNAVSVCGAIGMWGNVWEWTSTDRDNESKGVKGGCYETEFKDCRTSNRKEKRNAELGHEDTGFRIVREKI